MKRILVLCEGNICRSPMAEGLLRHTLPDIQVRSAGLGALVGMPADDMAIALMDERGLDIRGHRAMQVHRDMCMQADLVLVMDAQQRERLSAQYPQVRGKTFRVGEYIKQDVPDPYRGPEAEFRSAFALIDEGVAEWRRRIQKL